LNSNQESKKSTNVRLDNLTRATGPQGEKTGVKEITQLREEHVELVVGHISIELTKDLTQATTERRGRTSERHDFSSAFAIGQHAKCPKVKVTIDMSVGDYIPRHQRARFLELPF
jgi:hypothetical protein